MREKARKFRAFFISRTALCGTGIRDLDTIFSNLKKFPQQILRIFTLYRKEKEVRRMRRRILMIGTAVLTAASAVLSGCGTAKEKQEGRWGFTCYSSKFSSSLASLRK